MNQLLHFNANRLWQSLKNIIDDQIQWKRGNKVNYG